jgi:Arc/MetJ-type ribon-helix-helix transcriptional regulator
MATVTISLPDQFATQIDAAAKVQGFSTRSEFVRSLLRKYLVSQEIPFEVFRPKPINEVRLELAKTGKYSEQFIDSVTKGLSQSSPYDD